MYFCNFSERLSEKFMKEFNLIKIIFGKKTSIFSFVITNTDFTILMN